MDWYFGGASSGRRWRLSCCLSLFSQSTCRNSRLYLHTFAFVSSYFLICNPHLEAIEAFFSLFSYSHINFTTKMNTNVIKLNTFRGFLFSCVHYFSRQWCRLIAYSLLFYRLYNGNTVGQQFGPKCCRGDKIGCGISPDSDDGQVTVFFTKNGKEVRALCSSPTFRRCTYCIIVSRCTVLFLNVHAGGQRGNRSISGHSLPRRGDALSGRGSAAGPERWVGDRGGRRTDDSGQSRGWLELSSWCQTDWHSECSHWQEISQY